MNIQGYLAKMKGIQDNLLEFLESEDDFKDTLNQFTNFLTEQLVQNEILKDFLNLLSKISMNHHRTADFIKKIEDILTFLKKGIQSKISNTSLFNVFRDNKRILLFLFKNEFIKLDEYVYDHLISRYDYIDYFQPELISYETKKSIEDANFDENREEGENHNYLCKLIRNDSVEEFIIYLNKQNMSPTKTKIELTRFETNSFLIKKKDISLIEYAMFFGSIQIVKYLQLNDVDLNPSLWLYAIHSNNPELIHFLEENHVLPDDKTYQKCFIESVKCYHNNIAHYIQDNLLEKTTTNNDISLDLIEFYNFDFFPNDLENETLFSCLCKYDYLLLANIVIKDLDVNKAIHKIYLIKLMKFDNNFISHHYMQQLRKEIKKLFNFC